MVEIMCPVCAKGIRPPAGFGPPAVGDVALCPHCSALLVLIPSTTEPGDLEWSRATYWEFQAMSDAVKAAVRNWQPVEHEKQRRTA